MNSIEFLLQSDEKCTDAKVLVTVYCGVDVLRAVCPLPAADDNFDSKDWSHYLPFDDHYDLGCDIDCMDSLVLVMVLILQNSTLLTQLLGNRFREGLWTTRRTARFAGCLGGRVFPRLCIPAVLLVYSVYVQHSNAGGICADSREQMTSRSDSPFSI